MSGSDAILWQSARNLLDAQENLNKLLDAFWQIESSDSALRIEYFDQDVPDKDFLQPVWNFYFLHRRNTRANGKPLGIVTIGIQLTSDEGTEAVWQYGKRSKVLVGYSTSAQVDSAWKFATNNPNQAGYHASCVHERRFWRWEGIDNFDWFYGVPLDLLTDTKRVQELVITPVHEILCCGSAGDVVSNIDVALAKIESKLCLPPQPSA
jgi:hypothetical protein